MAIHCPAWSAFSRITVRPSASATEPSTVNEGSEQDVREAARIAAAKTIDMRIIKVKN